MTPTHTTSLIKVGWVAEPRALRGQLKIKFASRDSSFLENTDTIHLLKKDTPKPQAFKITFMEEHPQFVLVKLKGIDDRTQAESWVGAEVWAPENLFVSEAGEAPYLREIMGFNVFDKEKLLGPIVEFESNNSQDLLVVEVSLGGKVFKALIPLVKEFIVKIDYPLKKVLMDLPPGLVEVNSGGE